MSQSHIEMQLLAYLDGKTVAVVGNASTVLQWENGRRIDGCDVVVRFNKYHTGVDFYRHVGKRTDIVACALNHAPGVHRRQIFEYDDPKFVIAACPLPMPMENATVQRFLKNDLTGFVDRVYFVPGDFCTRLERELRCRPTTGCMFLHWLMERARPREVFLTGFSYQRLPVDHYHNNYGPRAFNYHTHDPVRELALFNAHRTPNVVVDDHIAGRLDESSSAIRAPAVNKPMYVGYYTKGTGYEEEARQCVESLCAFDLLHDVIDVPNLGSWQANTQYKAVFCRDMVRKYAGRPVVYVDVDARVRRFPDLFDRLDCDIAVHLKDGWELLGGTIYFGPGAAALRVCEAWIAENRRKPLVWDQKNLHAVLRSMRGEIRIENLPANYAQIFDSMRAAGEPVIEHMQASRSLKTKVARGEAGAAAARGAVRGDG